MDNLQFSEIGNLIEIFSIGASTGIFLGFAVWCVRLIINSFKKFF